MNLPINWTTKEEKYIVKNMKGRGIPSYDKLSKYIRLKYNIIDEKIISDIIEELGQYIWDIAIPYFYEHEYSKFIEMQNLMPVVTGRTNGWWGIDMGTNDFEYTSKLEEKIELIDSYLENKANEYERPSQWKDVLDEFVNYYLYRLKK